MKSEQIVYDQTTVPDISMRLKIANQNVVLWRVVLIGCFGFLSTSSTGSNRANKTVAASSEKV